MIALDGAKGAAQRGRDVRGAAVCVRGTQIVAMTAAPVEGHLPAEGKLWLHNVGLGEIVWKAFRSLHGRRTQRPHGEAAADGGLVVRFCIDRVEVARDGDLRERVIPLVL